MTASDSIACSLTEADQRERLESLRAGIFARTIDIRDHRDGIRFSFGNDDDIVRGVLELVWLERACCPFLQFDVCVPPQPGNVTLTFRGSDQVLEFVRSAFLPLAQGNSRA